MPPTAPQWWRSSRLASVLAPRCSASSMTTMCASASPIASSTFHGSPHESPAMTPIFVIENATVVLADRVIGGWVAVCNGLIAEVGEGRAPERGIDFAGDLLAPGLIELHTDHLESHLTP